MALVAYLPFDGREGRLMVGKGLYLSVIGIAIGLLAALALTRVLTSMLVEVKPRSRYLRLRLGPLPVDAVIASWLPAQRLAGLDPTTALRNE